MNKRGKVLMIYWFVILGIITVGVVGGVLVTREGFDIRDAEAGLLSVRLLDCLTLEGNLKLRVYNSENLLEVCNIDIVDDSSFYDGKMQYAIKLSLLKGDAIESSKSLGDSKLFDFCGRDDSDVSVCSGEYAYVNVNGVNKWLRVESAVGKRERNV